VTAAVAALQAAQPKPTGPTAEVVAEIEKAELERAPQKITNVPHRSRTGSTMILRIVESRDKNEFPHGRIVGFDDYRRPEGWDRVVGDGGLSPVTVGTAQHKKWCWQNFQMRDTNDLIGRAYEPWMANVEDKAAE
jgi:hypothetical protein